MIKLEIRFHRYEKQTKSFQVEKRETIKISFLHICNTIATTSSSTGTNINYFLMIVITKVYLVFENI